MLTRDDILKSKDLETVKVHVPAWGGDVLVSVMSGYDRDNFEASLIGKHGGTNMVNIRAKLVAATIVDEKGKLLFSEKDVVALGKKSAAALSVVFDAAQKINKISDDDVEELAKN